LKTEIRLSNESPYKIWAEYYLKCLWKVVRFIYHVIGLLVGLIFGKLLTLWNRLYEIVYENKKYLTKVVLKILALVEAVILVIFLVQYFYKEFLFFPSESNLVKNNSTAKLNLNRESYPLYLYSYVFLKEKP